MNAGDRPRYRHTVNLLLIVETVLCVLSSFILDVRFVDAPAGDHTGFLLLTSAVLALLFIARRIQPSLSPVDRGRRILCTYELVVLHLLRKNPSSKLCSIIRETRRATSRSHSKPSAVQAFCTPCVFGRSTDMNLFFSSFFSLISLIADGPHSRKIKDVPLPRTSRSVT